MGKVGWVIVGAGAGILFGKFLFSLPQSQVLVAKVQDKLDPIEVPEFDDFGDVAVFDPIVVSTPKAPATSPTTKTIVPTATATRTTSSPTTTTSLRTRLALR